MTEHGQNREPSPGSRLPQAPFQRLLRRLVPALGPKLATVLPSVVVGCVAGIAAVLWEADHRNPGDLLAIGAIVGLAAFAVAAVMISPAVHTLATLLQNERELDEARERYETSERRFRNIAESASDWFWEMGPDLRFSYFSERAEEIVGVPIEFHIGKTRAELAGEDVNTEKWQKHLQDIEDRKPFRDFRFIRKGHDGRLQYLSSSGKPVFGDDGAFMGYVGVGSDLTPQIEAEETARLANERLAAAVKAMTEQFALWDPLDRRVICNEQFRQFNLPVVESLAPDASFSDHIKRGIELGLYPDAVGREEEAFAERLERHVNPQGPFEQRRQDGRWHAVHEQKMADGSTITIVSDITERKDHETELARNEQRLADFADSAADWFWEQDRDFKFTYISVANAAISGMSAQSHYGKTRRETNLLGVSEAEMRAHEAVLEAHQPFDDFRFFRVRPDGSRVYLSTSGKPVFDEGGVFQGYRGVGRDITFLVEAELRVREERDRAEAANQAKSDFLARMSHELRTPMNAILGFSQVIRDETFGPVGANHYRDYAADIHRSGEHLLSLINDLLDLSKIEAGKLELNEESLEVGRVVEDLRRLFTGTAEDAGVTVDVRVPPGLPDLLADYRALRQMVTNLLSNAIKFTGAGGRVTIAADQGEDGGISIIVQDTGTGFDQADLDLVLSPFGRIDRPMVRTVDGSGLGLPIVKNLIELHGGTIELASQLGEGTAARLHFPPDRVVEIGGKVRAGN